MSDGIHSFISDLLHRRGIVDRDDFAQRAAAAVLKAKTWDAMGIKSSLDRVRTDLFRRYPGQKKADVTTLLADRICRRWKSRPEIKLEDAVPVKKIKILFVASNPVDHVANHPVTNAPLTTMPLGVDHEFREVKKKVRASKHRDLFEMVSYPAAQPDDLLDAFNEEQPHVVHFSGHGTKSNALVMLDTSGRAKLVPKHALNALFRAMKGQIRVVVLNACFSKGQASAITKHIDCAIGMREEIGDLAAITFAGAFYSALAYGMSVKNAFDQGLVAMQVNRISGDHIPKLMARDGVNPAKVTLVTN